MSKYSVRKPFTILVAVIIVIALGVVSVTRVTTDLMPPISIPYVMVITAYPGASPEKVESQVSEPLERALGTVSGVKNVNSVNSENASIVQLEFADGISMDKASLDISNALQQVTLPDGAAKPSMLELSMDMIATMYVGVSREGCDIYELSDFVKNDVTQHLERVDGVANVATVGLVERTVQVELNQEKINDVNDRILANVSEELDKAKKELDDAKKKVEDGQAELERQQAAFGSTIASGIFSGIEQQAGELTPQIKERLANLQKDVQTLKDAVDQMSKARQEAEQNLPNAAGGAGQNSASGSGAGQNAAGGANGGQNRSGRTGGFSGVSFSPVPPATEGGSAGGFYQTAVYVQPASYAGSYRSNASGGFRKMSAEGVGEESGQDPDPTQTPEPEPTETEAPAPTATEAPTEAPTQAPTATPTAQPTATAAPTSVPTVIPSVIPSVIPTGIPTGIPTNIPSVIPSGIPSQIPVPSGVPTTPEEAEKLVNDQIAAIENAIISLGGNVDQIPAVLAGLEQGFGALTQAQLTAAIAFSTAAGQLANAQTQLNAAQTQYETAREEALKNANLDMLLTTSTLSGMIYAQNFSMPAGYIDDKDDNSWLLKVGDEFDTPDSISDSLLADVEGVGTIRLTDVADVTVIDNAGLSYANLNGEEGILLSIYKGSTAGTNEVSKRCNAALAEIEEQYPGTDAVVLVDQGTYITLIIRSIVESMLLGALLAILILALFLRDVRPTVVVAISIPLSVLFAIVLMYFSDLSVNMMTLSGLALGIGMLVDNSIVVMENIFRLRNRGLTAPHAAVQGAKQVVGPILSSTLTTVCVFLPMIFTTGTVRQLLVPMALSITYCLTASLIVALTVVPASASTILRKVKPKENKLFDRILDLYGKSLDFCLRVKAVPLSIAIILLAVCIWDVTRTGIVMLPEMTANNIEVDIYTEEGLTREESYAQADDVMDVLRTIEGIEDVGIMDYASTASLFTTAGSGGSDTWGSYLCFVTADETLDEPGIKKVIEEMQEKTDPLPCEIVITTGGMGDLSSFTQSGMSVKVYGRDTEEMRKVADGVVEILEKQGGFEEISNGIEEGDKVLHLMIDKDKAMTYGLTVAGVYSEIAARLTTDVRSTSVTINGNDMDVMIVNNTDPLTKENLMDMEFSSSSVTAGTGMAGGAAGFGGSSGASSFGASSGASPFGAGSSGSGAGSLSSMFGGLTGEEDEEEENEEETEEEEEEESDTHKLSEFATVEETVGLTSIRRENQSRIITVTANAKEGENVTLLAREIQDDLADYNKTLPSGYSIDVGGESSQVNEMLVQMAGLMALAFLFVYLVMVAQFQSLLSPFIILFTIPLAFTGGMLGLIFARQQLSMLSLMGFLILMGTVVNNGIVFVDYANQLRIGGLPRRDALIATGKTRMRPILMTALTTILAMGQLIFGKDMGAQLGSGMAIVIASGLIYATLMTLYIVPVMYDIFFKKKPLSVDVGSEIDEVPDDAAEYLASLQNSGLSEETAAEGETLPEEETAAEGETTPEEEAPEEE